MPATREERTIRAMVAIYCHAHHAPTHGTLCEECLALFEYALARLGKCPLGPDKPVCAKCTIHCYRKDMRDQIREVMRYAGPRMVWKHPALALAHLMQKGRPAPSRGGKSASERGRSGETESAENPPEPPNVRDPHE